MRGPSFPARCDHRSRTSPASAEERAPSMSRGRDDTGDGIIAPFESPGRRNGGRPVRRGGSRRVRRVACCGERTSSGIVPRGTLRSDEVALPEPVAEEHGDRVSSAGFTGAILQRWSPRTLPGPSPRRPAARLSGWLASDGGAPAPRRPAARLSGWLASDGGAQPRDVLRSALRNARLGRRGPSPATSCGSHYVPGEARKGGFAPLPSSRLGRENDEHLELGPRRGAGLAGLHPDAVVVGEGYRDRAIPGRAGARDDTAGSSEHTSIPSQGEGARGDAAWRRRQLDDDADAGRRRHVALDLRDLGGGVASLVEILDGEGTEVVAVGARLQGAGPGGGVPHETTRAGGACRACRACRAARAGGTGTTA